jgi:PKD repeat protein
MLWIKKNCFYSKEFDIVEPVCKANFVYSKNDTTNVVSFVDISQGSVCFGNWLFGDGGFSDLSNPVYQYKTAGSYNVCLSIY